MISKAEFALRRKRLMAMMGSDSIAILPSASEMTRSRDTEYSFRQDSDFHYLCGFNEPEAVLILIPGRKHGDYIMFNRERDLVKETWHGRRAGQQGVMDKFNAADAFPVDDIDDILPGLMEGRETIYCAIGANKEFDERIIGWLSGASQGEIIDISHALHDFRLYKSASEIKLMRKAAEISAKAHIRAMEKARPGLYEYQIEAELLHEFATSGARFPAYNSIVASGDNACILHYVENESELKDGDLLMIDAGAEVDLYAADISRTFPVNGRFSEPQKIMYNWVLKAQLAAIETIKPGACWNAPHEAAVKILTKGLVEMGILKGKVSSLIKNEAYKAFYMHKTGHWLGLDVHDVGDYQVGGEPRVLEPGMVLTVEPGLYVPLNAKKVAKRWKGMGIRIEDDVLVTKNGFDVLSKNAPKTIPDIEAVMSKGN
ncbi:MAG: Xaa-Pro aminopeptidase [Gammaproteobacteria bacterium]|nr:MAG: Xaa-Pro aminopeptidase [Gammaproteobacteria bacterium]